MQNIGINECKVCGRYLTSWNASYCSTKCRELDSRLYYTNYGLKLSMMLLILLLLFSISLEFYWIYTLLATFAIIFVIMIPLYHFYQATIAEMEIRIYYQSRRQKRYREYDENMQPVHIYLYISRNQEDREHEEDFSEFI